MKSFLPALLTCLAAPVLADVGASASLTGLRYELVDLDPNDDVTPSARFTGQAFTQAFRGRYCGSSGSCDERGSFSQPALASIDFGNQSGLASVSPAGLIASVHWDNTPPGLNLAEAGGESLLTSRFRLNGLARYQGVPGQPLFVVSANTGLRITGQYTLDAFSDPSRDPLPILRTPEQAEANVFFRSRFIEGPEPIVRASASADWQSPADYVHETGEISVLLRNDKDHQATLWGRWGIEAVVAVPGVPEPSTYALMLAGVGLVVLVVKRRPAA